MGCMRTMALRPTSTPCTDSPMAAAARLVSQGPSSFSGKARASFFLLIVAILEACISTHAVCT